jgi:hypothetical protein
MFHGASIAALNSSNLLEFTGRQACRAERESSRNERAAREQEDKVSLADKPVVLEDLKAWVHATQVVSDIRAARRPLEFLGQRPGARQPLPMQ